LRDARDHGNATIGIHGMSAWGGWNSTRGVLVRAGWLDRESKITELGLWRLAVDLGEIPKDTPPPEAAAGAPKP
jgi:hypothetical protein